MTSKELTFFLILSLTPPAFTAEGALSTKRQAPSFQEINRWTGSETPITKESLRGKVILLSFISPTNIQSRWELSVLSKWYETYKSSTPFSVLGVAIPEFYFEKDVLQLENLTNKLKLPFPVAIDAEQKLQRAYEVGNTSTFFLIDTNGMLRERYINKIDYKLVEEKIQYLLQEANTEMPYIEQTKIPFFKGLPTFSFGYKKMAGFGNEEKVLAERSSHFTYPEKLECFRFYLSGQWLPREETLTSTPPQSAIKMIYESSPVFLVAGAIKKGLTPVEVRLDGKPVPKEHKGKDIIIQEGKSYLFIKEYRVYKLIGPKAPYGQHTIELIFDEPGVELFSAGFEGK